MQDFLLILSPKSWPSALKNHQIFRPLRCLIVSFDVSLCFAIYSAKGQPIFFYFFFFFHQWEIATFPTQCECWIKLPFVMPLCCKRGKQDWLWPVCRIGIHLLNYRFVLKAEMWFVKVDNFLVPLLPGANIINLIFKDVFP
jgi:hypothetical protein